MKLAIIPLLVVSLLPLVSNAPAAATVTILKNGSFVDGTPFYGRVTLASNGKIYGVATGGGANSAGTLFVMAPNGSGFVTIHDFIAATGSQPLQAPIEASDGKLYGTTNGGGSAGGGTVYTINKDGSGYTVLHNFTSATDGSSLYAGVVEASDGKLYGVASAGGTNSDGTIYRVRKDGTGFAVLRQLLNATDGEVPYGDLIQLPNGILYGTAASGGANGGGTIFSILTDGTGFTVLKALTSATDGSGPACTLLHDGGFLYGTTLSGGSFNGGVVFRLRTNGTAYTKLHQFSTVAPVSNQGFVPYASLSLGVDGRLYGMNTIGGVGNLGTIFSLGQTGGAFQVLHIFTGAATGSLPYFTKLISIRPDTFIATTTSGGANNLGAVFSLKVSLARPTVTVTPKPPKTTTSAALKIRGTAEAVAGLTRIEYKVGSTAFKKAKGKSPWSFVASLKPGNNVIQIRALDAINQKSKVKKIRITRK